MTEVTRCPNCNTVTAFDGGYPESQLDQLETAAKMSIVTPGEAARQAAQEIAQWLGLTGCVDGEAINEVAAIISKHCAAKAGEVERLKFQLFAAREANSLGDIEIHNLRLYNEDGSYTPVVRNIADHARANTISECVEKRGTITVLPFDAVPYIRRDDAVAVLEALAENKQESC